MRGREEEDEIIVVIGGWDEQRTMRTVYASVYYFLLQSHYITINAGKNVYYNNNPETSNSLAIVLFEFLLNAKWKHLKYKV